MPVYMMLVFLIAVSSVSYAISAYTLNRIHGLFELLALTEISQWTTLLVTQWGLGISCGGLLLYFMVAKFFSVRYTRWLGWLSGLWMGYLVLILFYGGSLHLLELVFGYFFSNIHHEISVSIAYLSIISIHIALIYGVWNSARAPLVKEVTIVDPHIGQALHGYRILQLSDIHIGPTLGIKFIKKLDRICGQVAPDLIVMTGDLVDGDVQFLGDEVRQFLMLNEHAKQGMLLITGNHEYISGAQPWVDFIQSHNGDILENEHRLYEVGDQHLAVIGIEDWDAHKFDPKREASLPKAIENLPKDCYKILLAHQPKAAPEASKLGINLQLSGHTHAGQIFPFNYLIYLDQPYNVGRYMLDQMTLYVNPGTGYWGPPLRIGTRAEVTLFTLNSTV
jgi:uncharacterized protein